jgi:TonB family protein
MPRIESTTLDVLSFRRRNRMRPYFLSLILASISAAQGTPSAVDVSGDVARVKAMSNVRLGKDILEKAAHYCDSAVSPDDACAEAYDWYGMALQADNKPETLFTIEPLYQRALELRPDNANNPASMALSLELEAMALVLIDPAYAPRAAPMQARARELRAASVNALEARPVVLPSMPLVNPDPAYKVGGGVVPPAITYKVDPEYAQEARLLKLSGAVMLSIVVDPSGRAKSIRIVKGMGFGLDEKAVEAVLMWVFRPGMKDGSPVNVRATIEVNFRLL